MRNLSRRLTGLGFVLLALAPLLIVGGALTLITKAAVDTVRSVQAGAAVLARAVDEQLAPGLRAIEASYGSVLAESAKLRDQVRGSLGQLGNLPDLTIQRGQLGSTPAIPLRVPDRNISLGLISLSNGQLLNQTLQGLPIPAQTIAIPASPLRQALAQAGQGMEQALQASERQLTSVLGVLGRVAAPLKAVGEAAAALVVPIRAQAGMLAGLLGLLVAVLVGFTLLYALIGIALAVTRGKDAASAFQTGGPVGYLGFVFSFLIMDGLARLLGRRLTEASAASPAELQASIDTLRGELEALRAELAPRPLRAAS
jgi:hypothetical protein